MPRSIRTSRGSSIAEAAAAMGLMLPLIFIILYVIIEISQAYLIRQGLAESARSAARQLAVAYSQDNDIKVNRRLQNKLVFDSIRIPNVINSSAQFQNPVWDQSGNPPTVAVTVSYTGGSNGLPAFPSPDPFNLQDMFHLAASSVYRVE